MSIPGGEVIEVAPKGNDADVMVQVEWGERTFLMFKIDLVNRGREVLTDSRGVQGPSEEL